MEATTDTAVLFGRRIRSLREARRLTQQELGEKAGLSYKYIGAIERGRENPTLRVAGKLADALEMEIRDVFELEHEQASPATLRKTATALLKEADEHTLRQAVKLLRALVR